MSFLRWYLALMAKFVLYVVIATFLAAFPLLCVLYLLSHATELG